MPTMVGKEKERGKERGEGDAIKNRYAQKNSGYGAVPIRTYAIFQPLRSKVKLATYLKWGCTGVST